jgi:hypothetical protein
MAEAYLGGHQVGVGPVWSPEPLTDPKKRHAREIAIDREEAWKARVASNNQQMENEQRDRLKKARMDSLEAKRQRDARLLRK